MAATKAKVSANAKNALRAKRQAVRRERWHNRLQNWPWYAALAEAFLLPLWHAGAEIALLFGVICLLVRAKADKTFHFRHYRFDVPVILFLVIGAASIFVSPDPGFSFYNYYNLAIVYALTYFLISQVVRDTYQVRQLLAAIFGAGLLMILYGFYQFIFGIDISSMKWVDGDAFPELRKRVFSTLENPNILAGWLDMLIGMAFGLFVQESSRKLKWLTGGFIVIAACCLAMTYARGAFFVIAVIFVGYGVLRDWRVLLGCVVVVAVLLMADPVLYERLTSVFTKMDTSTEMRLAFWESTIAMIQDHPLLGIGWGAYWMVYPLYDFYIQGAAVKIVHAHNIYLNYAAEIGIPGAIAFFWYFFGTMVMSLRRRFEPGDPVPGRKRLFPSHLHNGWRAEVQQAWTEFCRWPEDRFLSGVMLGIGLSLISVALNGITDDVLFNIPTSMFLWMTCGLAAAVAVMGKPGPDLTAKTISRGKSLLSDLTKKAASGDKKPVSGTEEKPVSEEKTSVSDGTPEPKDADEKEHVSEEAKNDEGRNGRETGTGEENAGKNAETADKK